MTATPVISGIALESIGPSLLAVSFVMAGISYAWTLRELHQPSRAYPENWTHTGIFYRPNNNARPS